MRIAMMTNNYKPVVGGVPIAIGRLAEGLRQRGHQVYIFAPEYQGEEEQEEFVIRYRAFHKKAGGYVPLMKPVDLEMERKFRELNFDMIHVHHPILIGQRAQYLGKKYGVPVVFTYHTQYEQYLHYWKPYRWLKEKGGSLEDKIVDFIENQLVLAVIRRFTEKCSLVIAPTNQMQKILKEREWEANVTVMPTGLPDFSYAEYWKQPTEQRLTREYIRGIYGKGKKNILCTVSRLSQEKNLKFMLKALVLLKEKIGDDFQLIVIGDGPQKQELQAYAQELGVLENVTFAKTVPNEEVAAFHCASDLFLFASKSETQGIVLLEAMAGGSPVVAVKATGVCDVIRSGQNGYVTEERQEEFAQRAAQILCDSSLYKKLAEGAGVTAQRYRNEAVAWIAEYNYERVLLAMKEHSHGFYKRSSCWR
ncbi:glycosyltransferase [Lachnospiraceae bacterium 45-W7]